ncbi:Pol protein [Phytophthora palmivora]|uniref:Pol protein n=1 Tax=Phytophthora palmivora TaxID=4796 RepID=A0A2P4YVB5_9STRA|nr:Pol protein [Phytophthora palmivora]
MVLLKPETSPEDLNSSSVMDEDILKNPEDPVYPLVKEYSDVVSKHPPSQLPPDRGVRHEIDLVPGTKYCVTRQKPLPHEQCEVIDAFFAEKAKSGMVRESKSPHSTPTFCVRKPNGKWRLVHAYNKLNNATVPAQTPTPRNDVLLNNMSGCTLYSALDMVDGYYQILKRESDIPVTPVSTPSGMLWEWLVMPQGLSNAPATFNRLVTQLFRPLRTFAQMYFDDIFVHSRAEGGQTAMEHLRRVFEVMRANKHYDNIDKCVFAVEEIKVFGCFVSRVRVRADSRKVKAIVAWPTPRSQKDHRAGYAELARLLSDLLKKDADWVWEQQHQDGIKASLQQAPVLALPDENKSISVVCDASDYAIGCALLQKHDEGRERVLKAAERNYPVHDKELLAMNSPLGHEALCDLYGSRVLADCHQLAASVAADGEPGKLNVLADALSRRPDYELAHVSQVTADLYDRIRLAYQGTRTTHHWCSSCPMTRTPKSTGFRLDSGRGSIAMSFPMPDGLLHYRVDPRDPPRVVVPTDEDLKYGILLEAHDAPISGHLGREKTYQMVSQTFWWPRMYNKMVHLAPVCDKVTGKQAAQLFLDSMFRCHGLPETIVSDRDPRFTGAFWDTLFQLLGTKLTMSPADHLQTDGQTECVNRVLEDTIRSICAETPLSWSDQPSVVEVALNKLVPASTGFTLRSTLFIVPTCLLDGFAVNRLDCPRAKAKSGRVVSSVESNKLKHRFIGPFAVLARHGAAYTIDLPKSMTHPTFYVGRLKRYHDPLDPPSQTEGGQGENASPRNEAESSGQPEPPVLKSVNDTQIGTHVIHTKGMAGPRLANLSGSLTTWSKTKDYLEADGLSSLNGDPTEIRPEVEGKKDKAEKEPRTNTRARDPPALLDQNGELHYYVERVAQERRRSGERQLLVKWRGYPSSQNSWEPEDRLQVD